MTDTNIDAEDRTGTEVMRRSEVEASDNSMELGPNSPVAEPLSLDEARQMRGSGWDGDLDEMWSFRAIDSTA